MGLIEKLNKWLEGVRDSLAFFYVNRNYSLGPKGRGGVYGGKLPPMQEIEHESEEVKSKPVKVLLACSSCGSSDRVKNKYGQVLCRRCWKSLRKQAKKMI